MVTFVWEIIRLVSSATEVLESNEKLFISDNELTCRTQVTKSVMTVFRLVNMYLTLPTRTVLDRPLDDI